MNLGPNLLGEISPPKSDECTRGEASGAGDGPHPTPLPLFPIEHFFFAVCLQRTYQSQALFVVWTWSLFMDSSMWEDVIPTSHPLPGRAEGRRTDRDDGHLKKDKPTMLCGTTGTPAGLRPVGMVLDSTV